MDGEFDELGLGDDGSTLDEEDTGLESEEELDLEDDGSGGGDDDPTIEIDGQDVPISEIKRWRDTRTNLESEYTKKFQGLAAQRRQLEGATPVLNWLRTNPQQARVLAALADGQITPDQAVQSLRSSVARSGRRAGTGTGGGQVPPEIVNRLNQVERIMVNQLQTQYDKQIESELSSLQGRAKAEGLEWSPEFEQELLQTAYDTGSSNLEHVYEALAYRRMKDQVAAAKKEGETETLKKLQDNRKKAGGILGGKQRGGAAPAKEPKSWKEVTAAAAADEALMKNLFNED